MYGITHSHGHRRIDGISKNGLELIGRIVPYIDAFVGVVEAEGRVGSDVESKAVAESLHETDLWRDTVSARADGSLSRVIGSRRKA